MGPNGQRAVAITPIIDVLLCKQEVVANDKNAVEMILEADVKRLKLLAKCPKIGR